MEEIFSVQIYDPKFFIKKLFGLKNNFWFENFWVDIILGQKFLVQRNFKSIKFWAQRNFESKNILGLRKLGPKSLVKIGSEIFLIWTNLARTNVA